MAESPLTSLKGALRGALITRDDGFYRDYFKGLKVIVPKAS